MNYTGSYHTCFWKVVSEIFNITRKMDALHCGQSKWEVTLSYYSTPNKFITLTKPLMI